MRSVSEFPNVADIETDILVLGAGLAGHRAALAARECGARVTMAYAGHGASPFVIGCNVPLGHSDPRDSADVYFEDMMCGGYHLNDPRLVRILADESLDAMHELVALGVPFARQGERFLQRHLSGNTYPRSVYVAQGTGRVILDYLAQQAKKRGIEMFAGWKAVALLRDDDAVVGCVLVKHQSNRLIAVRARAVVLAMGGIGRLYDDSTYPADIGATSYALAYDAGARLIDMEFVQFEPVVTVFPEGCRGMEMPTAMLGDGAHLVNAHGERFMFRYNPEHGETRIEKARMALCIQREIDEGRGLPDASVVFDTTVVPREKLESYILHCKRLRSAGLEPTETGPHVRPAAHSQMGGIAIDERGWTGIPGLFAGGEAAGGVHGASRIAGNGGSDTLVFGAVAGRGAAGGMVEADGRDWARIVGQAVAPLHVALNRAGAATPDEVKAVTRRIMAKSAGLYRNGTDLMAGLAQLTSIERNLGEGLRTHSLGEAVKALEVRNMVLSARMILESALARTESRGAHQRRDYPRQDDEHWLKHLAISQDAAGSMALDTLPIR